MTTRTAAIRTFAALVVGVIATCSGMPAAGALLAPSPEVLTLAPAPVSNLRYHPTGTTVTVSFDLAVPADAMVEIDTVRPNTSAPYFPVSLRSENYRRAPWTGVARTHFSRWLGNLRPGSHYWVVVTYRKKGTTGSVGYVRRYGFVTLRRQVTVVFEPSVYVADDGDSFSCGDMWFAFGVTPHDADHQMVSGEHCVSSGSWWTGEWPSPYVFHSGDFRDDTIHLSFDAVDDDGSPFSFDSCGTGSGIPVCGDSASAGATVWLTPESRTTENVTTPVVLDAAGGVDAVASATVYVSYH